MSLRRHLLLRNTSRDMLYEGPMLQTLPEEENNQKDVVVPITDLDATYLDMTLDGTVMPATLDPILESGEDENSEGAAAAAREPNHTEAAQTRSPIYRPFDRPFFTSSRRDGQSSFPNTYHVRPGTPYTEIEEPKQDTRKQKFHGPSGTPYTELKEPKQDTRKQKPIPPPLKFNFASTSRDNRGSLPPFSPITGSQRSLASIRDDDDLVPALPMSPAAFLASSTPAPNKDVTLNQSIVDSSIFINNPECNMCRICHEDGSKELLISPCDCTGTMGMLHMTCLEKWLGSSNTTKCEICQFKFIVQKKPHSFKWYMTEQSLKKERYLMIKDFAITLTLGLLMLLVNGLCLVFAVRLIKEGKSGPASILIIIVLGGMFFYFAWVWFVARRFLHQLRRWHDTHHTLQITQTTVPKAPSPPTESFRKSKLKLPRAFQSKKLQSEDIQPPTLNSSTYVSFSLETFQSYKAAMCNPVNPATEPLLQQDDNNNELTFLECHSASVMSLYEAEGENTVIYYQPSELGSTVTYCGDKGRLLRETGV